MSEETFESVTERERAPRKAGRNWFALLLAGVVVAVFAGVAWYALTNARGQDSQQTAAFVPPLLKAEPGPYKRKPEDPGGMRIPNQDKHVFERILPGPAVEPKEKLLPKPEEPVARPEPEQPELPEQDGRAGGNSGGVETASSEPAPPPAPAPASDDADPATAVPAAGADEGSAQEAEAASATPLTEEPETASNMVRLTADGRPLPPEKPLQLALAGPPAAAAVETKQVEPQADISAAYRLQLAAFRSHDQAMTAWRRLTGKYPAELDALTPLVVQVEIPQKGVFHRLQAGPYPSQQAAQSACETLKSKKQDCLIVKPQ